MSNEVPPSQSPLPIDSVLGSLVETLRNSSSLVLRAPTGSGKTTRILPALLDASLADDKHIVMLEPRRVAARAAARRIAYERGSQVGGEIGYQVRFDQKVTRDTKIHIVTDGVILRHLQDDPFLEKVAVVVFDEFHERGLNVDLALGMVRRVQQTVRPDLKIVVMSATLAAEPIAAYLGNCPIVEAEGRLFPVTVQYTGKEGTAFAGIPHGFFTDLAKTIERTLAVSPGDVLVFLPGVGEIRRTAEELDLVARRQNLAVMQLYGDLPAEQQDAVLNPSERRKVILATNVAETSITIEGVTAVVDTGLARVLQFDEHVGLDRLELTRISKASADQRAGRAGRTQPGVCVRLWSEREHRGLADQEEPEIRRVDLAGPVLELHCWGESDATRFPWFEPPRETAVRQAESLLRRLGALDDTGVTELGRQMVRLPVHPRIARLLIEGQRLGVPGQAALAAAMLAERDPFLRQPRGPNPRQRREAQHRSESDVVDRVAGLEEFERHGTEESEAGRLNIGAARFVLRARDQLLELLPPVDHSKNRSAAAEQRPDASLAGFAPTTPDEALQRALLAAFPDRVARRREMSQRRGVMVGGKGVQLADESAVSDSELFLCVDVDGRAGEALVRQASAVRREWLDPKLTGVRVDVIFDPRNERVTAFRRTLWDDLVLEEVPLAHIPDEQLSTALSAAAAENLPRVFPKDDAVTDFLERARCLAEWMPELKLPSLDDMLIKSLLPSLCHGCRSFEEVRRAPWLQWIKGLLTPAQLQIIEREAPERLPVPSGNKITLQYKAGKRPVLAVRIQELFGLADTPRIAGGRVPVLMHLLAPNMRPQQVTDDLKSFWNNTYQQVRKDLRARYPKHSWPEDPWNAPPQRKPRKRG